MDEEYIPRKSALQAIYTSTAPALEVKATPAADVVEVVHARPVKFYCDARTGRMITTCSACDLKIGPRDSFCKHCGAKMDGGQDE